MGKRHVSCVHENEGGFLCPQCPKSYLEDRHLQTHIRTVHMGVKDFMCDKCDQVFAHISSLRDHVRRVHEGLQFPCESCDMKFNRHRALRSHVAKIHLKNADSRQCEACGKVCSNKRMLDNHVEMEHAEVKKYKCQNCQRHFKDSYCLRKHQEKVCGTVAEDACFKCTVCVLTFVTEEACRRHERRTHIDRPHACPDCDSRFGKSWHLSEHMARFHSSSKDFQCPECLKDFALRKDMKRHYDEFSTHRSRGQFRLPCGTICRYCSPILNT